MTATADMTGSHAAGQGGALTRNYPNQMTSPALGGEEG